MAYSKQSQSDYKKKIIQAKVQWSLSDIAEGKRMQAYLKETGKSANAYIKQVIKADLDSKGVKYQHDIENGI